MEAKKFEPLHIEEICEYFKDKGIDIIAQMDEALPAISDERADAFGNKFVNESYPTDISRLLFCSFAMIKVYGDMFFHNNPLFESTFASIYLGMRKAKVFNITEDLFFKLVNTEIKNINPELIKMPFDNMVLSIPSLEVQASGDLVMVFKDIVLTYNEAENSILAQSFGEGRKGDQRMLEQSGMSLRLNCTSVEDMIQLSLDDVLLARKTSKDKKMTDIDFNDDETIYRRHYSFIINSLLYICSMESFNHTPAKRYVTKKKKTKANRLKEATKVAEKNKDLSKIGRIVIGSNRRLTDDEYSCLTNLKNVVSCPKWLVRGHWRSQACGIKMTDRRMKWIEPYTKGKGMLEEINQKQYLVK
jgi:hypothetical protein